MSIKSLERFRLTGYKFFFATVGVFALLFIFFIAEHVLYQNIFNVTPEYVDSLFYARVAVCVIVLLTTSMYLGFLYQITAKNTDTDTEMEFISYIFSFVLVCLFAIFVSGLTYPVVHVVHPGYVYQSGTSELRTFDDEKAYFSWHDYPTKGMTSHLMNQDKTQVIKYKVSGQRIKLTIFYTLFTSTDDFLKYRTHNELDKWVVAKLVLFKSDNEAILKRLVENDGLYADNYSVFHKAAVAYFKTAFDTRGMHFKEIRISRI